MLEKQKRKSDKLRKKLKRYNSTSKEHVSESPGSKTRRQLQHASVSSEVRRSLLVHNALMANTKDAFFTNKKRAHRRIMSGLVTGRILKKNGLKNELVLLID